MALARKLTKEQHAALSDALKGEYVEVKGEFVLDLTGEDESVAQLRSEAAAEKSARLAAEGKLTAADSAASLAREEAARKSGDLVTLERELTDRLTRELAAAKTEGQGALSKANAAVERLLIDGKVNEMASSLSSKSHKLLAPHIRSRVAVDMSGEAPVLKVLGADGKPSEMSLDDLRGEFYANADYAAIIDGSKASGGGSQKKEPVGTQQQQPQQQDLAASSPAALVAHLDSLS